MIICMSDIICVTNRKLCRGDFFERIENISKTKPRAIILREKDLSEEEYKTLAVIIMGICKKQGVMFVPHFFWHCAAKLNLPAVHVPLPQLRSMSASEKALFSYIGASCHSVEDALEAEALGCSYITAGHIFETDCKKGVTPRGIGLLSEICKSVDIPVYAIGGITHGNYADVMRAGANGYCVMSGAMRCDNVEKYMEKFLI